jgi:exopolysaccharide production protein ExoZ
LTDRPATFVNIQQLRALAAYMVVFVHLEPLLAPLGLGARFVSFAASGVDIFFVISGFIMVHTTQRDPPSPWTYMRSRLRRIVPLYWTLTLVVAASAMAAPTLFLHTRVTPDHFVKSLLFIPYLRDDATIRPLLFLGWSLNYEMFFYVLFAAGLAFASYRRGLAFVATVLIVLVAAGPFVADTSVIGAFYTRPILLEFVAGMGLALALPRMAGARTPAGVGAALIAAGFTGFGLSAAYVTGFVAHSINLGSAAAIVGGALLLECKGRRVGTAFGLAMGQASYALYLSHPFVTRLVCWAYAALPGAGVVGAVAAIALAFILATLLGWLVFQWVEKPTTRLAGRLLPSPAAV